MLQNVSPILRILMKAFREMHARQIEMLFVLNGNEKFRMSWRKRSWEIDVFRMKCCCLSSKKSSFSNGNIDLHCEHFYETRRLSLSYFEHSIVFSFDGEPLLCAWIHLSSTCAYISPNYTGIIWSTNTHKCARSLSTKCNVWQNKHTQIE